MENNLIKEIERKNKVHFSKQWGDKFTSFNNFSDQDFVTHLLKCTLTIPEDWKEKKAFEGGAGIGRNTLAAIGLGIKNIVCTELSKGGVESCKKNLINYPICTIYQSSLTKIEKEIDNVYDIVFSVNCIPHIPNYKDALKEMVRICKPGGLILFNVPPVRDKLVSEVDNEIRKYSTRMCPKCKELFAKIIVYLANKKEISQSLVGKMELSGDLLSAYDHMGLPFTQEFTKKQIVQDINELGCDILDIDDKISVKARKK